MGNSMQAEIVIIGTELLLGKMEDTNAAYIAQQLTDIGLDLYCKTTVGEDERRLTSILQQALARSDVVITSGGLCPNGDDVTRRAVARVAGRELVLDEKLLAQIELCFTRHGFTMNEDKRYLAYIPQGAIPIENPVGIAPGFMVETEQGLIISLPGVPRELRYLMETWVIPFLMEKLEIGEVIIKSRATPLALPDVSWMEGEEAREAPEEEVTVPLGLKLTVPDNGREVEVPLTEGVSIGRFDPASGSFPDVDLTSYGGLERGISRYHAKITRRESGVFIEDLGSVNGTFLNHKKLTPYVPERLRNGDELRLGKLVLRISFTE
jgi:molybdenum cofactor synthesis domain-containing protein